MGSIMRRHDVEYYTGPKGPRSGPGYVVLVHPHLIGPMRPTRGHTATFPQRLICNAFAVRERLGDPRVAGLHQWVSDNFTG